jgi:hypothetical protein
MSDELIDFIATAPDGESLPRLAGVETDHPIRIVAVLRTADQIRMTFRREIPDIRHPRAAARALAARQPRPLLA